MYSNRIKKNQEILNILKILAPGTQLRAGLENILKAKTGGLVVLNNSEEIMKVVDGGFYINADYNPAYIYELAKMDGAIVISTDLKKIVCANTQLIPDYTLTTHETGTRHRTAQRMAKQFDIITIAISQRRTMITIYKGDIKYVLRESAVILQRANQAIQTLEKYISVLDRAVSSLNLLEFQDIVTLFEVITSIQRTELVLRIVAEIEMFIIELGNEGRLISMQLSELIHNVERDGLLIIRDYCNKEGDYLKVHDRIEELSEEDLLDMDLIAKLLGYGEYSIVDTMISPKGYRTMSKIQRLPNSVIENVVSNFGELRFIMEASLEELDQVEGIGEARAKSIRNGLRRLKEQSLLNYKA